MYQFMSPHNLPRNITDQRPSHRGVILIALLWVLTALSLLALNLASTVRSEVKVAQASGEAEKAYFYARGGLEEALYHLVFPDKDQEKQSRLFPYAGGMNHYWMNSDEMICHVAVLDEAGKIDLNFAREETLEKLLENLGVAESRQASIVKAIVEWRRPNPKETDSTYDALSAGPYKIKHRPFSSVEELLLVRGMTREILYGRPQRKKDGRVAGRRGLAEFVTVYSGKSQININYAEPELLAAMPGLNWDIAESIGQARKTKPFKSSSELSQRITGTIPGEALSLLTTELSARYCLIATAFVKGSNVRRSIKVVAKRDDTLKSRHEKLIWYDEYWPLDPLLKWTEAKQRLQSNAEQRI